jgi:hypothetical protein
MADDRDKLKSRPAPPHIRAQTAQPGRLRPRPPDSAAPLDEISEFESETPVFGDPLQRVEYRQRRASQQLFAMREKFDALEKQQQQATVTMVEVKTKAQVVAAMLEKLIEDQVEARREREQRAENREIELAKQKTESRKLTMSIVAPTVTALGAAIAAIIAAIVAAR